MIQKKIRIARPGPEVRVVVLGFCGWRYILSSVQVPRRLSYTSRLQLSDDMPRDYHTYFFNNQQLTRYQRI